LKTVRHEHDAESLKYESFLRAVATGKKWVEKLFHFDAVFTGREVLNEKLVLVLET
jgi:hypothetical protein